MKVKQNNESEKFKKKELERELEKLEVLKKQKKKTKIIRYKIVKIAGKPFQKVLGDGVYWVRLKVVGERSKIAKEIKVPLTNPFEANGLKRGEWIEMEVYE